MFGVIILLGRAQRVKLYCRKCNVIFLNCIK